jgi:NADPH2:quinone reductase
MKAWRVIRYGEVADALTLTEHAEPEPGAGQLLVRVLGAALGYPDVLLCRGTYQAVTPLPLTPGGELCGEVVALGRGDSGFSLGDRVIGTAAFPDGALAEYALIDAAKAYPAPPSLDDAAASALFVSYQTAWFGLHRRAHLQAGETLLVHAAAGGVGSAVIQLGKAAGATVIAVVGGGDKAAVAAGLGADVVVDRFREDFVEVVEKVTGGHGADVVFETVGADAYKGSTRCVAFEGRIVVAGFTAGMPAPALDHTMLKNYSIVGMHLERFRRQEPAAIADVHAELTALADTGVVVPLLDGRIALTDAADGLIRLGAGQTVGRLVVVP